MKLITINDRYVVVEKRRDIDRKYNSFHVEFSLEMKYGVAPEARDDSIKSIFVIQFGKEQDLELWTSFKDSERDDFLSDFYDELVAFLPKEKLASEGSFEGEEWLEILKEFKFQGRLLNIARWINTKIIDANLKLEEV